MKLALYFLLAGTAGPLAAQNYTFQVYTSCGRETIRPVMMDALGTVVGQAFASGGSVGYGMLYQNGACKLYPAADFVAVSEIGDILGFNGNGSSLSYLLSVGKVYELPLYPDAASTIYCCFDPKSGALGGNYIPFTGGAYIGFFYANGHFYSLPYSNGMKTPLFDDQLAAVNNSGVAVGTYYSATLAAGFVYSSGKFTYFLYPNSGITNFYGINDNNQVIGYAYSNHGLNQYFLYDIATGSYTDIDLAGHQVSIPIGISNAGVIAFQDGATGGLLLATPVVPN